MRRARRGLGAALAAVALAGACDRPFEPFEENLSGPFSMLGYLDLRADTQWVRVMPVRQSLLAGPDPIDAAVTLERVGGRTVAMRDSLFRYEDERLDGVAYAHVFWTTERLEPKARYRIRATRADGAASTVEVEMPPDLELSLLNAEAARDTGWLEVRAERVLAIETFHPMRTASWEPGGSVAKRQRAPSKVGELNVVAIDGTPPFADSLVPLGRTELSVATVTSAWPADARLPQVNVGETGTMPSNVQNGLGYVGAAATWTIPYHRCTVLARRPDDSQTCAIQYNARSAYLSGRVIRQPCGRPEIQSDIRLTQRFADGAAVMLRWRTGWAGEYRFEGIEPGAELSIQSGDAPPVPLPRLAPGQRYSAPDLFVTPTGPC